MKKTTGKKSPVQAKKTPKNSPKPKAVKKEAVSKGKQGQKAVPVKNSPTKKNSTVSSQKRTVKLQSVPVVPTDVPVEEQELKKGRKTEKNRRKDKGRSQKRTTAKTSTTNKTTRNEKAKRSQTSTTEQTISNKQGKKVRSVAGATAVPTGDDADSTALPTLDAATKQKRRFANTIKRFFRKGKLLRPDAQVPSDSLIKAIVGVVKQGNYPEIASRALGVRSATFKDWVVRGFEDIQNGDPTQYALFVVALDAADAQAEVQDVTLIRAGIENWQALAWLRERRSFQRWGMKALQLQGESQEALPGGRPKDPELVLEPEVTGKVLAALEEAGVVVVAGSEHLSGPPEEIQVDARQVQDDGDSVVVALED